MALKQSSTTRIRRALAAIAAVGEFYAVKYENGDTKLPAIDDCERVVPEGISTNELQTKSQEDKRYGAARIEKYSQWQFLLTLEWKGEVDLEAFRQALMLEPLFLAADDANDLPSVTLLLQACTTDHPPAQAPGNGTVAKLLFNAELGRN